MADVSCTGCSRICGSFMRMNRLRLVSGIGLIVLATIARAQEEPTPPAPGEAASATERALDELSSAYQTLAGLIGQGSDEAMDRVQGDIENLGDWEYRIVALHNSAVDSIEDKLNRLGDERWEVFWVESSAEGTRFFLKRPAISYVSRVPLSTLLRLLSGVGQ